MLPVDTNVIVGPIIAEDCTQLFKNNKNNKADIFFLIFTYKFYNEINATQDRIHYNA